MMPVINAGAAEAFGRANVILTGWGDRNTPAAGFRGPLSLKGVLRGYIDWHTPERRFRVWPDTFVLLNKGQSYVLSTEAEQRCKTFCVFFEDGLVENAIRQLIVSPDVLLEDTATSEPFGFHEQLTPVSTPSGAAFARLALAVANNSTSLELDWLLHGLASRVALGAIAESRRQEGLSSVKASTRREICRRLKLARAVMEEDLSARWTLKDMGVAAAMAPHHFARCFSTCFRETPRAYLIRRRLERARVLLQSSRFTVTQACLEVGYESVSSFSTAYRKLHGEPPSKTRVWN